MAIPSKKKILSTVLLLVLLVSIPLGLNLVKQQQDARSRAAGSQDINNGYDSQKLRGTGFNSFFARETTYQIDKRANNKWTRIRFDWYFTQSREMSDECWDQLLANPTANQTTLDCPINWDYLISFENQLNKAKQEGMLIESTFQLSPVWTNGWIDKLNDSEKDKYLPADWRNKQSITLSKRNIHVYPPIAGCIDKKVDVAHQYGLYFNNGPMSDVGKRNLTKLSEYLMKRFPQIELWSLNNEPNIHHDPANLAQGREVPALGYSWGGIFGYAIKNDGSAIEAVDPSATLILDGPEEFAKFTKAFYQGKINARSAKSVSYTGGSMWLYVGTHPDVINRYDHNFDRLALAKLKEVCPENGCVDVVNFHMYDAKDKKPNCGNNLGNKNANPTSPSREDYLACHDPYSASELKGKIRRVKYEISDILGMAKPLFISELGFAFYDDPDGRTAYEVAKRRAKITEYLKTYPEDKRTVDQVIQEENAIYFEEAGLKQMSGKVIKFLAESRSEGVDGIIWYELGGQHCNGERLLRHAYSHWVADSNGREHCAEEHPYGNPTNDEHNKTYEDGPVFGAYSYTADMLNNYNFVNIGGLNSDAANKADFYIYTFKHKTENKIRKLIWKKSENPNLREYTLPGSEFYTGNRTLFRSLEATNTTLPPVTLASSATKEQVRFNEVIVVEYTPTASEINTTGPRAQIDQVGVGNAQGYINFKGWAVSENKAIDRVELLIANSDGQNERKVADLGYGLVRDDLTFCGGIPGHRTTNFINIQCPFIGIYGDINAKSLNIPAGTYKLKVKAYDGLGNVVTVPWNTSSPEVGTGQDSVFLLVSSQGVPEIQVNTTDNRAPFGHFDTVDSSCTLYGWAADPDSSTPTRVDIYVDGPAGTGVWKANAVADRSKNPGESIPDNSRFVISLPADLKDNREHDIYIYGIDPLPNSPNTLLPGSPKRVRCTGSGGGLSSTQPTPTPTGSNNPGTGVVGLIIQYFGQSGNSSQGDQNSDNKVNEIDFGAVYSP